MSGHDPFRGQTDSLTGAPAGPAPLTGAAASAPRVPTGSVAEVKDWLANAKSAEQAHQRATAALAAETAKAKPRKGIVAAAEAILST